jgi:hypothetical protein
MSVKGLRRLFGSLTRASNNLLLLIFLFIIKLKMKRSLRKKLQVVEIESPSDFPFIQLYNLI